MSIKNITDVHNQVKKINKYLSPLTTMKEIAIDLKFNMEYFSEKDSDEIKSNLRILSRDVDYMRAIIREFELFIK